VGAVAAGFIADRFTTKKTIISLFGLLTICYVLLLLFSPEKTSRVLIFINLGFTILVVFALRGVYFALFEETRVPKNLTGTTIGLVSLVGFTPDIFFNSVAGRIIDASPGKEGYFNFYLLLMIFAFVGLLTTILLRTKNAR
jgi:sugar phosphate permease